jgi:hypothetical protein
MSNSNETRTIEVAALLLAMNADDPVELASADFTITLEADEYLSDHWTWYENAGQLQDCVFADGEDLATLYLYYPADETELSPSDYLASRIASYTK